MAVTEGKVKVFTRENLPPAEDFAEYRKTATTKATRVVGTMKVVTREGIIEVKDGWLAIDTNGWPYPIADDVFQKSYEPAGESKPRMASSLDAAEAVSEEA